MAQRQFQHLRMIDQRPGRGHAEIDDTLQRMWLLCRPQAIETRACRSWQRDLVTQVGQNGGWRNPDVRPMQARQIRRLFELKSRRADRPGQADTTAVHRG